MVSRKSFNVKMKFKSQSLEEKIVDVCQNFEMNTS